MQLLADYRQAEKAQEALFSIIRECVPPRESAEVKIEAITRQSRRTSFVAIVVLLPDRTYSRLDYHPHHHHCSCMRLCLSALSFHLCIIPRAGEHKCFIESPRDSSSLRRSLCPVVGKESCSRLHEHDTRQRGTRVSVSCTFSIILRSDNDDGLSRSAPLYPTLSRIDSDHEAIGSKVIRTEGFEIVTILVYLILFLL